MKNIFIGMLFLTLVTNFSLAQSTDFAPAIDQDETSQILIDHSKEKPFHPDEKTNSSAKKSKKSKKQKDPKKNTEKMEESSVPEGQ